ncbi:MAG: TIGR02281 family clan AA aspartic protease [Caulobacteraceae bacterium]
MFKHLAIVALAVLSSLAGAYGVVNLAHATARPPVIAKGADGHYWAQASVNGRPVRFLVDTGSSAVTLSAADAARLGFDTRKLDYARPVITVSGHTTAARVMLDHVDVAGAQVEQVQALVLRDGPSTSLLGMSYLGRLSSFEATPTALVLRR